ncbi:MAG: cytochrome c biogenesis protein CcsA [Chitinophagales bacterium]
MFDFLAHRFGANGFIGETLWIGHLGHFFIVFCFAASLLAFLSYFGAELSRNEARKASWQKLARIAYISQASAIFGVFVLLFIMILNHHFEYHYAWRHSSTDLPLKYIISSFWEGQEGSFLLWMFWLAVMGIVGMRLLQNYERPVLGIVSLTQAFLASMVMGVYIFGFKLGSSPFILLRNQMDLQQMAPVVFADENNLHNYLSFIKDGNGLNVLLQNYWMTIHPPVLFLGFASTTFPFAFALGSLLRRDWDGWVKAAMPWALFSVAVLGTGILMGGAWAYESLSFGGFWAWDPVENMSFVPWLMVVAGLHTLLVYKYTRHSAISTYVFFILGFVLVLYSTYLTRSGRLGDTSVHSFTDDGLEPQLLAYLFFFIVGSFTLLIIRLVKGEIPSQKKDEELMSREFWMFIGSLVLLLSAIQMTFTTSIPVWNLIFHEKLALFKDKIAPPEDAVQHYNSIQIWLGIIAAILTGLVQFLAYKVGKPGKGVRWALYTFAASFALSIVIALAAGINFTQQYTIDLTVLSPSLYFKFNFIAAYYVFLLAGIYAVLGNLAYLVFVIKGNIKLSGGSIAHFGFGIFLLGALISQGKKEIISTGAPIQGLDAKERAENILLMKDSSDHMGNYTVTYTGSRQEKKSSYFSVLYKRIDNGNVKEEFVLSPEASVMKGGALNANPDTKHYLTRDVFTHITSIPDNTNLKDSIGFAELEMPAKPNIPLQDSFRFRQNIVHVDSIVGDPQLPPGYDLTDKLAVGVNVSVTAPDGITYRAQPVLVIDRVQGTLNTVPATMDELGYTFEIQRIDPSNKKLTISAHYKEKALDYIVLKAIIFPYINLVWLGGIITFIGALMSMWRRAKENKLTTS